MKTVTASFAETLEAPQLSKPVCLNRRAAAQYRALVL
jgi:hypothetical protein